MKMLLGDADDFPAGDSWSLSEYSAVFSDMEDFWSSMDKRAEKLDMLETMPFSDFALNDAELNDILDWNFDQHKELVHHDCMWAGTCSDRYHPNHDPNFFNVLNTPTTPVDLKPTPIVPPPSPIPQMTVQSTTPGRSLLINAVRPQPQTVIPQHQPQHTIASRKTFKTMIPSPESPRRPDTPQSLDEEEHPQFRHSLDIVACAPIDIASKIIDEYGQDEEGEEEVDEEEEEDDFDDEDYTNIQYTRNTQENTVATDHSYTLSKNSKPTRVELPGVQTPSDSEEEEEIDVVSLVEKKGLLMGRGPAALPTNPSPLARRQLQRTVATGLGARPSPAPPRKRPRERSASPVTRHRKRPKAARQRSQQPPPPPRHSPAKRRPFSSSNSDSEAENIERRSLHNDMERQRRIGLKNLFDELKSVVPSICQKDRAPKVVVLREAASLCNRMQREERDMEREMEQMKFKQARLMARVRHLRRELASRRPQNS